MIKYKLKELLTIKNGKDHKELPDGTIPVYGSGGLMRYVNEFLYDKESILLPRKGTLSNIQYVNTPFWTVDTLYYTVVDTKKVNAFYLYYLIKQFDLSKLNTGTGVPSMTFDSYYDLEVCIPDLAVQNEIADILKSLDSKIALNNRINAELEAMAKTVYDYWFVQFDFPFDFAQGKPSAESKPYISSGGKMVWSEELKREVPEGWEVKKIASIADCNKWTINNKTNFEFINYLDTSNLTNNQIDSFININCKTDKMPSRAMRVISLNDILISTVRPNQCHYGIIKEPVPNMIASSGFAQIRSKKESISNDLLYFYLTDKRTIDRLQQIAETSVSAYPSISPTDIMNLNFCFPKDAKILTEANKLFDSINSKISKNQHENQQLSSLRDWLLPMLMNGQVKVQPLAPEAEQELERLMAAEPEEEYGRKY